MGKVLSHGLMERHTQEGSKMVRCMGLAFINLEMARPMKDTMKMIKRKAMESTHLKLVRFIKASSKITSNMVKEFS